MSFYCQRVNMAWPATPDAVTLLLLNVAGGKQAGDLLANGSGRYAKARLEFLDGLRALPLKQGKQGAGRVAYSGSCFDHAVHLLPELFLTSTRYYQMRFLSIGYVYNIDRFADAARCLPASASRGELRARCPSSDLARCPARREP